MKLLVTYAELTSDSKYSGTQERAKFMTLKQAQAAVFKWRKDDDAIHVVSWTVMKKCKSGYRPLSDREYDRYFPETNDD